MYEDVNAKCPYFVTSSDRVIRCEGAIEGTNTEVRFAKVCRLPRHRFDFCDSDCWKGCPVAQMLNQKNE